MTDSIQTQLAELDVVHISSKNEQAVLSLAEAGMGLRRNRGEGD